MPRKTNSRAAQGSGTIRQRPDGRWEARYTVGRDPGTGKQIQRSIYGATQKEVRQRLQQVEISIDDGTYVQPSRLEVGEWLNVWLNDYCVDLKPGTISLYRRHIRNYLAPYIGAVKLCELSPHMVQRLYNRLATGKDGAPTLTPKTVKNVHGILHRAMEQAAEIGYLKLNPVDHCKPPRVEKPEIKPLDGAAISKFLTAIQGHQYEAVYIVDLFTGMRQSEILGLTWDCIDFEDGTIRIYRQFQLIDGVYQFGALKNDKPRTIVPAPSVLEVLKEQRRKQREWKLRAGNLWQNADDFVFTDEFGKHLARQSVYHQFKAVMKRIGLPDTRFHDLRHSYAVASIQAGDDIKTVQENLGHHTAAFTLDVYGHVTGEMKRASANRMEAFIQRVK